MLKLKIITVCFFLAFIARASSCRVTEENLLFENVQSGPPSFFECFHSSKGSRFCILLGGRGIVLLVLMQRKQRR